MELELGKATIDGTRSVYQVALNAADDTHATASDRRTLQLRTCR